MATVSMNTYWSDRASFFRFHNYDFETFTSPMDQYGCWYKNYTFKDGAMWSELYSPVTEEVTTVGEAHGIEVKLTKEVKFLKTEYYNTDNATSRYCYEVY